jgi:hypothetical protein
MSHDHVVDRHASKLKQERSDGADAFIPESAQISGTSDGLAESLAEQYLREASGDDSEDGARDDVVPEELGGPFVESGPQDEYGPTRQGRSDGDVEVDDAGRLASGATRNPMPQAVGPLALAGPDEEAQEAQDETPEQNDNRSSLTASEVHQASLEAESGSRMESPVEVDRPSMLEEAAAAPITDIRSRRKR